MALSSSSTLAEVRAEREDAADYDLVGSIAKCKTFIQATRILLSRMPSKANHSGSDIEFDRNSFLKELASALLWLRAVDPAPVAGFGGTKNYDLSGYRD